MTEVRPLHQQGLISIRETNYTGESVARGVFADVQLPAGALIEAAHCIRLPAVEQREHFQFTVLQHYTFNADKGDYLLALGIGSLFNHSSSPNVDYRVDTKHDIIRYFTARKIAAGEELFIFYGPNLWFTDTRPGADEAALVEGTAPDDDGDGLPLGC